MNSNQIINPIRRRKNQQPRLRFSDLSLKDRKKIKQRILNRKKQIIKTTKPGDQYAKSK